MKIFIFDGSGRLVWESEPQSTDRADSLDFSSQPFHAGPEAAQVDIKVGSLQFSWDGKAKDGFLVGTGDYQVKAQISGPNNAFTVYSKALTVILRVSNPLSLARAYPLPAYESMTFDLTSLPAGLNVEIEIWNLAGELVKRLALPSGPQGTLLWKLDTASGRDLAHGIYIAVMRTQSEDPRLQDRRVLKLILMKK